MIHPPRRRRERRLRLLLVVGSTVVALTAAEIGVRIFLPYNTPDTLARYSLSYTSTAFTRQRLAPEGRLVEVDAAKAWGTKPEGDPAERTFHINGLGFRGPSFSPRKPEGVRRVFVMGGSSVFDQNVSDPSPDVGGSWPNRAQTLLRERNVGDVEVINGGTPGHSSLDVLGRLTSEIWLYEPDVVVLYTGWNEIKGFRAWEISPEAPPAATVRAFVPGEDPFRAYRGRFDRWLSHSQLYVKVRNRVVGGGLALGPEGRLPEGEPGSSYGPWGPRQYALNVRSFVDVVRNAGALPVLATQATLVTDGLPVERASSIGSRYQLLDPASLVRAFAEVHGVLRAVAAEKSVPLLDAAAVLSGEPSYFADHVHLTPEGSEALARLTADALEPLLASRPEGGPRSPR